MADFAPPAKKARLDGDADAPGSRSLNDAPGSPVDDLDDDFYETSAADNAQSAAAPQDAPLKGGLDSMDSMDSMGDAPPTEPVSAAGAQIPGLGHWGEPSAQQQPDAHDEGGSEDGELSDEDNFYSEVNPDTPAAGHLQPVGHAPQPQNGAEASAAAAAALIPDGEEPRGLKRKAPTPPAEVPDDDDTTLVDAITAAISQDDATHAEPQDDGKAEFLEAAAANKDNKDAEWELDSQASSSSSSDSSSDDSSSDEDGEASDDGELLTPEEMVKRLLEADPDEDDPSASKTTKVRTQNEVVETYVKPDIAMKDDTKITELGTVESIVDNMLVVKANTSGDYQVLEAGSALCLANRTIIGQVSETIGRVQDPRYSVGFSDAAEIDTLNITKDMPIYYVDEHSSFVFTEPLRAQKHTDASGQYDEEAKMEEFSDDEQEAEHKRNLKQQKKARAQGAEEPPFNPPTGPSAYRERSPPNPSTYTGGGLKYSDDEDEDLGMYKPLARPDRFEDIVGAGAPLEDRSHVRRGMMRGGRGGWMDRGRGFRGRGGGGRGDRGGMGAGQGGGRADRGGMGGQRGGDRNDRGGSGRNGRGDRADRGGRPHGGSPERPARQEEQPRRAPLPPQQDVRPNFRAQFSPAGSPPQQDVGPSPRGGKKRNKKRNRRERERERREQERLREQERERERDRDRERERDRERSAQPPAAANATAYTSNQTQNHGGWNSASATAPATSYGQPPAPPPAQAPSNYYVNPGLFPQQPAAAAQPAAPPAQPQANQQAWAQWIQIAAMMQQAQAQGQTLQAPPPPPPQPQAQPPSYSQYTQQQQPPQQHQYQQQQHHQQQTQQQPLAQYGYGYQQYQQPPQPQPTPPADPRLQHHQQPQQPPQQPAQATPSIQDILRALGQSQSSGR